MLAYTMDPMGLWCRSVESTWFENGPGPFLCITRRQQLLSAMCGARREVVDPGRPMVPVVSSQQAMAFWIYLGGLFHMRRFRHGESTGHGFPPKKKPVWKTHDFSATNPPGPPVWTMGQKLKRLRWVFQLSNLLRQKAPKLVFFKTQFQ